MIFFVGVPILWTLGIILAVVGAILARAGSNGRQIGGRAHCKPGPAVSISITPNLVPANHSI
jgi:hypothetical protein